MEFRYAHEGKWGGWIHPEEISEEAHFTWRMGPRSKLYHVNQGAAFHLWQEQDRFEHQEKSASVYFPRSMGYGLAMHYAEEFAYHFMGEPEIDSLQVKLILLDPKASDREQVLEFPTYMPEK